MITDKESMIPTANYDTSSLTFIALDIPTTTDIDVAESIAENFAAQVKGTINASTITENDDFWKFNITTEESERRIQSISRVTVEMHGDTTIEVCPMAA